jgi:hypothetical protein
MKYVVEIREVHFATVIVEAENEDDARKQAVEHLWNNNDIEMEYSHTLDREDWPVREYQED